jgi:hypothetical protein
VVVESEVVAGEHMMVWGSRGSSCCDSCCDYALQDCFVIAYWLRGRIVEDVREVRATGEAAGERLGHVRHNQSAIRMVCQLMDSFLDGLD